MTRALASITIAIGVLVTAAPARADKGPATAAAQARFAAGSAAYDADDFAGAAREFEAGFAAEPWSGFLFAWGQAERRRGDCEKAVELFDRFLATGPTGKAAQKARTGLALCAAAGSTGTEPPPEVGPTADAVTADAGDDEPVAVPTGGAAASGARTDTRTDRPRSRGFHHKLAVGLVAGGVVAGAVAGYAYYLARRDARDAPGLPTLPEVEARYDRAASRLTIARVAGVVGGGLVIGGVLRFILHRPAPEGNAGIAISPAGGVVVWGRF